MVPVELELYNLTCDAQECEVSFLQEAERRGIIFHSNKTCEGDEIGWDFICLVKKSKMSFTGFCTEMSRCYQTNAMNSMKFEPQYFCEMVLCLDICIPDRLQERN